MAGLFDPLSPNPGSTNTKGVRQHRSNCSLLTVPGLHEPSLLQIVPCRPRCRQSPHSLSNARSLPTCSQDWETEGRKAGRSIMSALPAERKTFMVAEATALDT